MCIWDFLGRGNEHRQVLRQGCSWGVDEHKGPLCLKKTEQVKIRDVCFSYYFMSEKDVLKNHTVNQEHNCIPSCLED